MNNEQQKCIIKCPDDGKCHHACVLACWRVKFCLPLSSYGENWTKKDLENNGTSEIK